LARACHGRTRVPVCLCPCGYGTGTGKLVLPYGTRKVRRDGALLRDNHGGDY